DVEQHWAKEDINEMASRMVIAGVDEGHFAPGRSITRAEFAAILVQALGLQNNNHDAVFADLNRSDWFYDAAMAASQYKLISGYADGTFQPGRTITRAEAMVMIARAMEVAGIETSLSEQDISQQLALFGDQARIAEWAKSAVAVGSKYGIVSGTNAVFAPDSKLTRAEAAVFVRRILQQAKLI
ncbi:MAG: S-layer homology domain-containing protein, partial [Clostridia bacterium]